MHSDSDQNRLRREGMGARRHGVDDVEDGDEPPAKHDVPVAIPGALSFSVEPPPRRRDDVPECASRSCCEGVVQDVQQ